MLHEDDLPGLSAKSDSPAFSLVLGMVSRLVIMVENVPPDIPVPLSLHADVDMSIVVDGPANDLSVLFATYATMSEGTESKPAKGTMTVFDLEAA